MRDSTFLLQECAKARARSSHPTISAYVLKQRSGRTSEEPGKTCAQAALRAVAQPKRLDTNRKQELRAQAPDPELGTQPGERPAPRMQRNVRTSVQTNKSLAPDLQSSPQDCSVGLVVIARGKHPVPSRTRPLSPVAPMVLRLKTWESRSPPDQIALK